MSMADVGAGGEEAVVTFEGIAILTPRYLTRSINSSACFCLWFIISNMPYLCRGRYNVELHLSFLHLQGQANDFKIQYSSVVRLFLLPKVLQIFLALEPCPVSYFTIPD